MSTWIPLDLLKNVERSYTWNGTSFERFNMHSPMNPELLRCSLLSQIVTSSCEEFASRTCAWVFPSSEVDWRNIFPLGLINILHKPVVVELCSACLQRVKRGGGRKNRGVAPSLP